MSFGPVPQDAAVDGQGWTPIAETRSHPPQSMIMTLVDRCLALRRHARDSTSPSATIYYHQSAVDAGGRTGAHTACPLPPLACT